MGQLDGTEKVTLLNRPNYCTCKKIEIGHHSTVAQWMAAWAAVVASRVRIPASLTSKMI